MKEISAYPIKEIQSVILGENYANIKARLDQLRPDLTSLFASFKVDGDDGIWYGKDNIVYHQFQNASEIQKEEIAAQLEMAKQSLCDNPPEKMDCFVKQLFTVPSESQIFWYEDMDGRAHVTLTQWGFLNREMESHEDVIQVLIDKERPLTQVPVTLKFIYSNLESASDYEFKLHLFNNEKVCKTNEQGEYHVGTLYAGKKIAVSTLDGLHSQEFYIEKGKEFITTINREIDYTITVKNQYGDLVPDFPLEIDANIVATDSSGVYYGKDILEPESQISVSVSGKEVFTFKLSDNPDNNNFIVEIHEEVKNVPDTFRVKLLDYNGKPLTQMPFKIMSGNKVVTESITDVNGCAMVPIVGFQNKAKYQIMFEDSKSYREKLKAERSQNHE